MTWIKLLFPTPHFELHHLHPLVQKVHGKALLIAYYLTQALNLILLSVLFVLIIVPIHFFLRLQKGDLLDEKWSSSQKSYFKTEDALKDFDFERMY